MKRPHKWSFAPPPVQPSNVLFLFVLRSQISIHPTYSPQCDLFKERSSKCPIDRREQSLRWRNPEIAKEEQESGVFPGFPTAGLLSGRPGSDKHFRKIAHKFGAFVHETVAADSNVGMLDLPHDTPWPWSSSVNWVHRRYEEGCGDEGRLYDIR